MRNFTNNLDFVNVSANIETTRNNGSFTEVIALIIFDGTSLTMDGFQTAVSGHTFSRRIAGLTLISQGGEFQLLGHKHFYGNLFP